MTPLRTALLDTIAIACCASSATIALMSPTGPLWLRAATCAAFGALAIWKAYTIARDIASLTRQRDELCDRVRELCDRPRRISNVVNIGEARR